MMRELRRLIGATVTVYVDGLPPEGSVDGTLNAASDALVEVADDSEGGPGSDRPLVTVIPWLRVQAIRVWEFPEPPVWNPDDGGQDG